MRSLLPKVVFRAIELFISWWLSETVFKKSGKGELMLFSDPSTVFI